MGKGVITLGEALIDFIPVDNKQLTYSKSPGGAPANVAVGLAKLGTNATFIGKVGDDLLGHFLKDTLASYQVDISGIVMTREARTGLTFVSLDATGDRSFEFFIDPSADQLLRKTDVREELFQTRNIFHFGSISLIHADAKQATLQAIHYAKTNEMLISYDPNLRLALWENERAAKETIQSVLEAVDVLKLAEDELMFLMGSMCKSSLQKLAEQYQIPLIFVTLGSDGSIVYFQGEVVHVPALEVEVVDTTGAGDAFMSAILHQLDTFSKPLQQIMISEIKKMTEFASVSGGLATTSKGAMTALPNKSALKQYLST
ncbi:aminoimidazole riboside kinase [Virgibacillus soli]|uniref:aminoimidazole riboside kinase n=1 Tax=Paracerasibacillus soli TaxID=480284 RepID=UPI0035EC0633